MGLVFGIALVIFVACVGTAALVLLWERQAP